MDRQAAFDRSDGVDIDPDFAELGRRICVRRIALGLSQEAMALEAGYDRSFIGKVERGERNVSFRTLCRLCVVLRCDVATLTVGIPKLTTAPILAE